VKIFFRKNGVISVLLNKPAKKDIFYQNLLHLVLGARHETVNRKSLRALVPPCTLSVRECSL
jgi:hypothetical protein